jgi:uncharacterized membrane protein YbaN (DUF454 family)
MHLYFGNSVEEFYPHKTISTRMKFSLSLSSSIQCHVSIFNAHDETPLRLTLEAGSRALRGRIKLFLEVAGII